MAGAAARRRGAAGAARGSREETQAAPQTRRLDLLRRGLRQLLDEYASWQSNLPEFAADTPTAERLAETVEALETAADALEEVDPPRGYGRD